MEAVVRLREVVSVLDDADRAGRAQGYPELFAEARWRKLANQYGLTPRELGVLREVCCGWTNMDIAARLKVHPITLRTHLRSLYRKLGCRDRVDLLLRLLHGHCRAAPDCPYSFLRMSQQPP